MDPSQPGGQPSDQINLGLLKKHYKKLFWKYLEEKPGQKTLFIDKSILKVLSFVLEREPESAKIKQKFILSDKLVFQPENPTVVFLVRPDRDVVK
jgi:hypothetical protein